MHIVILAWLYVLLMMAMTLRSVVAGALLFLVAGLLPVALYGWMMLRRRQARRAASVLEREVCAGDDGDA